MAVLVCIPTNSVRGFPYLHTLSSIYCYLGGAVQMACQGFLVREACVGVLVGGAGFLLSGVQ